MNQKIVSFHQDERQDWVADLECGHGQHVRHNPPWMNRPWVITPEGREKWLAVELDCKKCDEDRSPHRERTFGPTGLPSGGVIMPIHPIEAWRQLVANKDAAGVESLLAEDVVFHSPIVDTPQVGKAVTRQYLTAAFEIFSRELFRYVRGVVGERDAILEFIVEIDGVSVNGVDMIRWNDEGLIVDFKVMLRPLRAMKVMHQKIATLLQATS